MFESDKGGAPEANIDPTDWMKKLFGNEETAGIMPTATDMATGAISAWLGYKQLGVAQENVALQKEAFAENKAKANMEAALKLDAMQRGLSFHGVQSDTVDKYSAQYSNK